MKRTPRTKATPLGEELRTLAAQYDATAVACVHGTGGHDKDLEMVLLHRGRAEGLRDAAARFDQWVGRGGAPAGGAPRRSCVVGAADDAMARLTRLEDRVEALEKRRPPLDRRTQRGMDGAASPTDRGPSHPAPSTDRPELGAGEVKTLAAIAQLQALHGDPGPSIRVDTLVAVTGAAPRTLHNHLVALRGLDLVESDLRAHRVTSLGRAKVGGYPPFLFGEDLLDHWVRELPEGEAKILSHVAEAKDSVRVSTIAEAVGSALRTVHNNVVALVGKRLLTRPGHGLVALAPVLRETER